MNTVLWGATGQAVVLRELFEARGDRVVAIFDNNPHVTSPFEDVPLYYGPAGFQEWLRDCPDRRIQGIAAIGGTYGSDRLDIHAMLAAAGVSIAQAVHPTAFVAPDVMVGEGVQVMAHATVCARAILGDAVIVNTAASVDHESRVGRGVHIGPGAVLAGCVTVDELAFIGAGAVVLPRLRIGRKSTVGAGATVTRNVEPGTVVVGTPARQTT